MQINFAEEINITEEEVETSVIMNGVYLKSDVKHMLKGDTVFVEANALVKAYGGTIDWKAETRSVLISLGSRTIELTIDNHLSLVDGREVELYKVPYIQSGRTMIPLKVVSEYFGSKLEWDQLTYTVRIDNELITVPEELSYERTYTDEDLYTLAKIVTVESGEQSFEMALAIANTVLNRVKDSRFPNTVVDVIYQVDVHTQFPPAHKESFKTLTPGYLSTIAAKRALEGVNNIGMSLYFNNQPFRSKTDDLIRIIDGEYFYN
jgi:hypothetical protein